MQAVPAVVVAPAPVALPQMIIEIDKECYIRVKCEREFGLFY